MCYQFSVIFFQLFCLFLVCKIDQECSNSIAESSNILTTLSFSIHEEHVQYITSEIDELLFTSSSSISVMSSNQSGTFNVHLSIHIDWLHSSVLDNSFQKRFL